MEAKTQEKPTKLIPEKVIGFKSEKVDFKIDTEKTIMYALGIGFSEDSSNREHLKFTYELGDLQVFPTYAAVIPLNMYGEFFGSCPGIPDFNFMSLLHGEEWIELVKPLPINGSIQYQCEIVDMEDKGKGTVISVQARIYNKDEFLAVVTSNLFVRGLKGDGIKSKGILKYSLPKVPESTPLKEITLKTYSNQAILYRLGGNDPNPLHVDYDMAALGGFDKPILHGLCSYGITGKAAYELFGNNDIENLQSFKARFTSHVFPGESLNIQFWKKDGNTIIVSAKTVERKKQILIGELTFKKPKF